jgi:hypothetical protein
MGTPSGFHNFFGELLKLPHGYPTISTNFVRIFYRTENGEAKARKLGQAIEWIINNPTASVPGAIRGRRFDEFKSSDGEVAIE